MVDQIGKSDEPRKREGFQRVQIGLTGLAGVILLVGLANIVVQRARLDEQALPPAVLPAPGGDAVNASNPSREPLAELGVTPSAEQSGQYVPDLQPDPNLRKPMDRYPQGR